MRSTSLAAVLFPLACAAFSPDAEAQDAARGQRAYRVCLPCHLADRETNKQGPHLKGIFGRTAGQVDGFRYSKAMLDAGATGLVWDEANLAEFLSSPKGKVPGTSMRFWGLWSRSEIDDIIAYLKTNP